MKSLILLGVVACLVGCGSGGNTGTTSGATPTAADVQKSVIDGGWQRKIDTIPVELIIFRDGHASQISFMANSNYSKDGTFAVSGDVLTINYTSSDISIAGQALSGIGNNPGVTSTIHDTRVYKFVLAGNTLTLTDPSGFVEIFTR